MYGRRRGGGKGYRSNPIGMGGAVPRSSPDGPVRGGYYNSEYRNFNRGFGRGQPKFVRSPQPLPRGDLFMEAGRLAAEYLVAKGKLSPNALPPKFQNGGFKKEVGDFQQFRQQDGENMSRKNALARLGSSEGGSDRKRFSNDYSPAGSKHRGRRETGTGSYNHYDSDWGHDNGRSGTISGRSRASSDKEADDDALSVHHDEKLSSKGSGDDLQNHKAVELAPKSDGAGKSLSESDKHQPGTSLSSKSSLSAADDDCQHITGTEDGKERADSRNFNVEGGEVEESKSDEEIGQHSPLEDSVIQHNEGVATRASKKRKDLLQLCNFTKVPTRTRSPRSRGSKGNNPTSTEERNTSGTSIVAAKTTDIDGIDRSTVSASLEQTAMVGEHNSVGSLVDLEVSVDDNVVAAPSKPIAAVDQNLDLTTDRILFADKSDQSFRDAVLSDTGGGVEGSETLGSPSFPDSSFAYTQESNQGRNGIIGYESVNEFVATERKGEKRVLDERAYKTPKVWSPSMISQDDEYPNLSNITTEGITVTERRSPTNNIMMIGHESSSHISGFTTSAHNNSIGYAEDKPLIDNSFKICDLNLMEGSDINESRDGSQMMFFSPMPEVKKEPLPIDGGLTIGGNSNTSHKYSTIGAHGKQVEIIDLESDFGGEMPFNPGEKREEAVYTGLESFPSHARCTNGGTDVQDGYGLMISELLGNGIPNCSAVTGDISSLHNDIDLLNGQGMLPEDDSIYMTLGEIPIGFWEPPNPEFGKPF